MDARAHSSLLVLLVEDRNEIRAARANILSYSATFTSAVLATISVSLGENAILDKGKAILLATGFLVIYIVAATALYIGLCETRKVLNYRENLLMSNGHAEDCVRIFYRSLADYEPKRHLISTNGDTQFLGVIIGTIVVSMAVILFSTFSA